MGFYPQCKSMSAALHVFLDSPDTNEAFHVIRDIPGQNVFGGKCFPFLKRQKAEFFIKRTVPAGYL